MPNLDGLKEIIIDTLYKYMGLDNTVSKDYFKDIAEEVVKQVKEIQ